MVTWLPVPDGYVHGILRGYRLLFKIDGDRFYRNVTTVSQSFELTGLEKFTNYSVKVLAFTRIGDGNVSGPFLVSTDEDGKLLAHLHHFLLRARAFYAYYARSNHCCISFHMTSFIWRTKYSSCKFYLSGWKTCLFLPGLTKKIAQRVTISYDVSGISIVKGVMRLQRKFAGKLLLLGYEQTELQKYLLRKTCSPFTQPDINCQRYLTRKLGSEFVEMLFFSYKPALFGLFSDVFND